MLDINGQVLIYTQRFIKHENHKVHSPCLAIPVGRPHLSMSFTCAYIVIIKVFISQRTKIKNYIYAKEWFKQAIFAYYLLKKKQFQVY